MASSAGTSESLIWRSTVSNWSRAMASVNSGARLKARDFRLNLLSQSALRFHPENLLHCVRLLSNPARPLALTALGQTEAGDHFLDGRAAMRSSSSRIENSAVSRSPISSRNMCKGARKPSSRETPSVWPWSNRSSEARVGL